MSNNLPRASVSGSIEKVENNLIKHSKFNLSKSIKFTANHGDWTPFYIDKVRQGDVYNFKSFQVTQFSSPLFPTMDNIYASMDYFFVPSRLLQDDFPKVFGADQPINAPAVTTSTASCNYDAASPLPVGSMADTLGLPMRAALTGSTVVGGKDLTALPGRALAKIWHEWYSDQNINTVPFLNRDSSQSVTYSESNDTGSGTYIAQPTSPQNIKIINIQILGSPPKVNKRKDYFTSALPFVQKGTAPIVPVLGTMSGVPLQTNSGDSAINSITYFNEGYGSLVFGTQSQVSANSNLGINSQSSPIYGGTVYASPSGSSIGTNAITGTNLVASGTVTGLGFDIADLRMNSALQKFLELDARSGTRYIEYILAHDGVSNDDLTIGRSVYIHGETHMIHMNQSVQTSSSQGNSVSGSATPQGNKVGVSTTAHGSKSTYYSVKEHGFIIGIYYTRVNHSYQECLDPLWTELGRFDYFDPLFDHLSEQPVFNSELNYTGSASQSLVFGYRPAWDYMRHDRNVIAGLFRSSAPANLDAYHYADDYSDEDPVLNESWLAESSNNIDRTLAINSTVAPNLLVDIVLKGTKIRNMSVFGTPSLHKI